MDKLKEILHIHLTYIEENRGIPRLIFSEAIHQNDPILRQTLLRMVNHYLDLVRGILLHALESGRVKKDININTTAIAFLGLVQSVTFIWFLSGFEFPLHQEATALWQVFSESLS